MDCTHVRVELSARLDGEVSPEVARVLDDHLVTCSACRTYETRLREVRSTLRLRPSEESGPDLVPGVMQQLRTERIHVTPRATWLERFRIAAVAAVAAALVLFGATRPFTVLPGDIATASEITEGVRAAARTLNAYRARFEVSERGWHPDVPIRTFTADVSFRAPEDLHLTVSDQTAYPSDQWPTNDYELIANKSQWWIEESSTCPEQGLPACAAPTTWAGVTERRSVIGRQPFDGTTPLPTDMLVPLETLASSGAFRVEDRGSVAGEPAVQVELEFRYAQPLIASLQIGGAWRPFHPLDRVDVWLDTDTWFPLRYRVSASQAPDRQAWAQRLGLGDRAGEILLDVEAVSFGEPDVFLDAIFKAPATGIVRDGGFIAKAISSSSSPVDLPPALELYRAGRSGHQTIRAYSDGMTYVKVVFEPVSGPASPITSEELKVGKRFFYYQPASLTSGRQVDIFGRHSHVSLESNLPRAELLDIAQSSSVAGSRAPVLIQRGGGIQVKRIEPAVLDANDSVVEFALRPRYLPSGYSASAALLTRGPTFDSITIYYRGAEAEFDDAGIRVVQTSDIDILPPSSEEFLNARIAGNVGRWSVERSELEWIDGDVYRAVAVPSGDLATALQIARSLR